MRRKDKEITDPAVLMEIIHGSHICRIAMIDGNQPYLVPMNYGFADHALYFHSAMGGRKFEALKRNSRVCFEIEYLSEVIKDEIPCEWTSKYRSVIGYGHIRFITDTEEKKKGLDIIMAHHGRKGLNVYKDNLLDAIVVLRLDIQEMTGKQSGDWEE
jgi:nitroimidazol reductase NimA-like FMN-containing flavoprotein (pyridoxamine 5'-phosphate oxidase superfamily)